MHTSTPLRNSPPIPARRVSQPAPRKMVVLTAAIMVALMAIVLPPLHTSEGVRAHLLIYGWPPALLVARVCWAVHRGAIRRRVTTALSVFGSDDRRWALVVRDPEVVRASESPVRFQLYVLFEIGIAVVVFLMFVGGAFGPLVGAAGN